MDAFLSAVCKVAAEGVGAGFARILQYRADERAFVLQAGTGWPAYLIGRARVGAGQETPAGRAWHTGQPVLTHDRVADGARRPPATLAEQGIRRTIVVPIRSEAEAFGVLEVGSVVAGDFAGHDVSFMQAVAHVAATALERQSDRAAQREAATLAEERGLLLHELQYRLRHDLQDINALAWLRARRCDDPAHRAGLKRVARHITALATLYGHLGAETKTVEVGDYLHALFARIAEGEEFTRRRVAVVADLQPLRLEPARPSCWASSQAS